MLYIPSANCAKRKFPDIIEHNNVLNHKRNENVVVGDGRINFPIVNKSDTAEVKKVEIELATSLQNGIEEIAFN